ncbi:MAG: histidine phosphatase family protein [Leptolyngbya sp.]|nr:histidine phosphatase family protein [Leptolyngbya sp.]
MPKHLIFFRHGKSDWEASFDRDYDRPVAERGRRAAQTMGRWLAATQRVPDLAITSSAVRAKTTLDLAMTAGQWGCPTQETDALYEATVDRVLGVIHQQPDRCQSLMLVGHEPAWSDTLTYLGGGTVRMPTAAMACLRVEVDRWIQVRQGRGTLLWLMPPKLVTVGMLP